MLQRRKKTTAPPAGDAASGLGDTESEGEDRWQGDPDEEPQPVGKPEAKRSSQKDRHPMPWNLVITDVFHLDVHKTYKQLETELTLGDAATEYGSVLHAVDKAAANLFLARRLARKAKLVDEEFTLEMDQKLEVYRSAAAQALVEEHQQGKRSKAATKQDIEDRLIASFKDEVTELRLRRSEMHGAFRAIEGLEQAWDRRCSSLQKIADGYKRAGAA